MGSSPTRSTMRTKNIKVIRSHEWINIDKAMLGSYDLDFIFKNACLKIEDVIFITNLEWPLTKNFYKYEDHCSGR